MEVAAPAQPGAAAAAEDDDDELKATSITNSDPSDWSSDSAGDDYQIQKGCSVDIEQLEQPEQQEADEDNVLAVSLSSTAALAEECRDSGGESCDTDSLDSTTPATPPQVQHGLVTPCDDTGACATSADSCDEDSLEGVQVVEPEQMEQLCTSVCSANLPVAGAVQVVYVSPEPDDDDDKYDDNGVCERASAPAEQRRRDDDDDDDYINDGDDDVVYPDDFQVAHGDAENIFDEVHPFPPAQLWKTVILEESEPESSSSVSGSRLSSLRLSSSSNSSGVALSEIHDQTSIVETILNQDPIVSTGPITQAVRQWLVSAPIEIQLLSTTVVADDEEDDQDDGEDEEDLPKNEQLNPCTAPSSELCDGPQLRVGCDPCSTPPAAQQEPKSPPPEIFLPITYDPAKYSMYYNISAVSLDDEEEDEDEEHDDERDPATIKGGACIESKLMLIDSSILLAADVPGSSKKKKNKRPPERASWRRSFQAARAMQLLKKTPNKNKSGQSYCAIQ